MSHTFKQKKPHANYLMLITVPMRRISSGVFAVESAFGNHLLMLQSKLNPKFENFVIAAPNMPENYYKQNKDYLLNIDEYHSGIRLELLDMCQFKLASFFRACFDPKYYREIFKVFKLVKQADLVHAGPTVSFFPTPLFYGLIYAILIRKKTVFVWDTDQRRSSWMLYKMRKISLRDRVVLYFLYNIILDMQIRFAVRFCSLVLLKSRHIIDDYTRDNSNVKWLLNPEFKLKMIKDSIFLKEHIIEEWHHLGKTRDTRNGTAPLELVYFGRLLSHKGVDLSIKAVKLAKEAGANIQFSIIGEGEEKENLHQLVDKLSLKDIVRFYGPIKYGKDLFKELYKYQILLATPLSEDTPRSALDAMACGMGILAFDTSYYKNDIYVSGAVCVVPWPSVEALAKTIVHFDNNREEVAKLMDNALKYAKANTQEIWIDRRIKWTLALFEKKEDVI